MKEVTLKEKTVMPWLMEGIRKDFLAFQIDELGYFPGTQAPLLNSIGLELSCKSLLIAEKVDFSSINDGRIAKEKAIKVATKCSHKLVKMMERIVSLDQKGKDSILDTEFDNYIGRTLCEALEKAYIECRYPVTDPFYKNFPVKGVPGSHWLPFASSGIEKFCLKAIKLIMSMLKDRHALRIEREWFQRNLDGEQGQRYCNLLFMDGFGESYFTDK